MDINFRLVAASLSMMTAASAPVVAAPDSSVAAIESECQQADHCEALIQFLVATGGDIRADTVERGLAKAFGVLTMKDAAHIPGFLRDLFAMGLTPEARGLVQDGLFGSVCSSSLSAEQKSDLLRSIVDVPGGGAGIGLARGTFGDAAQTIDFCNSVRAAYTT